MIFRFSNTAISPEMSALLGPLSAQNGRATPASTGYVAPAPASGSADWSDTAANTDTDPFSEDHFEFTTDFDDAAPAIADTPPDIPTADAGDDGRPDPDPGPDPEPDPEPNPGPATSEDADPDNPPPPVDQPDPPQGPTDQGRPEDRVPAPQPDSPPSPPPGTDNADFGRPPGLLPDPPPDPGTANTYTSGGPAGTSYNVTIEFVGTWTLELQSAFVDAADYLSSIILADLPDVFVNGVFVDDITITATLTPIDGVGGVLGSAGPREIRNDGTYLPASGAMTFDSADAQNQLGLGNWETIVLHEMMHALGFGTLWTLMGLTSGSVAGGDIRFTGINATETYLTEFSGIAAADPGASQGVPVEADGGVGTAGGHWDEFLFDTEIMTGYVDTGGYVSVMTIAALEDMGYDTVFDNPYSATDLTGPIPTDPLMDLFV